MRGYTVCPFKSALHPCVPCSVSEGADISLPSDFCLGFPYRWHQGRWVHVRKEVGVFIPWTASWMGGRLARCATEGHSEVVISYKFPFTWPFRISDGNILGFCQFQVTPGLLIVLPSPALSMMNSPFIKLPSVTLLEFFISFLQSPLRRLLLQRAACNGEGFQVRASVMCISGYSY